MPANTWDGSGVLRPFDPTKYAVKNTTTQPTTAKPAEDHNTEKAKPVEESPGTAMNHETGPKHTAKEGHHALTQVEKKSKSTAKPATEAAPEADTTENDPDETLRLASLRLVKKIYTMKINGRYMDFAEIDGWTCLVPRRAFREGDMILYFENDAFLPAADDRFASLRPLQMFEGKLGYRVKTRRFGTDESKIITQGYVYPVEKFPEIWDDVSSVRQIIMTGTWALNERMASLITLAIYREMTNWAERLGIKKWEETQPGQPQLENPKLGKFPKHIFSGTDITRLQDCPNLFSHTKYHKKEYQESVKLDGASMTVYFVKKNSRYFKELNTLPEKIGPNTVLSNGRFGVCSKKVDLNELQVCNFGFWKTALQYDLPAKLSKVGRNIAISGELCGDGINRNREGIPDGKNEFFVFSMFDIDRQKHLEPREVVIRATQLGLKHVPVVGYVKIPEIAKGHGDLQKRADEKEGEGLVFKCVGDGRSFKVLSNTYLVKHNL
ncbi:hypothetical protein VSDG_00450 [Cytospora chrysosperma]|uniref:RNA ligase domain-containing protein n=1 Tax=Cytospora chrysosperma TaxID=252740 RepID=A0A423WNV3_CYTCH|nr:hypothetical protein VSDG_00450 [Valsa sordida]